MRSKHLYIEENVRCFNNACLTHSSSRKCSGQVIPNIRERACLDMTKRDLMISTLAYSKICKQNCSMNNENHLITSLKSLSVLPPYC